VPVLAAVVLAGSAAFAVFAWVQAHSTASQRQTTLSAIRVSGIPATVPTRLASLMGLQPEKPLTAPGFTLTDQAGRTVSLASFRGRPVVLTFFDPHCHTECPLVSQEFVDAEHDLSGAHTGVVFLAINVNRHALSVATVLAFSKEHELTTIPTWHFLTGSLPILRRLWREYGIEVATRIVHGHWTVLHTSIVFFISPQGQERYVAAPLADYHDTPTHRAYLPQLTLKAWGRGIALVTKSLVH
jgi:protein SCO1/2